MSQQIHIIWHISTFTSHLLTLPSLPRQLPFGVSTRVFSGARQLYSCSLNNRASRCTNEGKTIHGSVNSTLMCHYILTPCCIRGKCIYITSCREGLEQDRASLFSNCVRVCSVVSDFLQSHGLQPARLLCPWDFPGKNTGVGCHFLLQGSFLTRGMNHIFCVF